jgi:hypothetical protein
MLVVKAVGLVWHCLLVAWFVVNGAKQHQYDHLRKVQQRSLGELPGALPNDNDAQVPYDHSAEPHDSTLGNSSDDQRNRTYLGATR